MKKRYLKDWMVWGIITIQFCLFMLLSGECDNQLIKVPMVFLVVLNHMWLVRDSKIYNFYK